MLPSRRVLAYDTSYFALCQHLFSDFFRFFSKSIIGGVRQQRTLYIVGCAGGHVSRHCGKFGSVGVGAHCICARGLRRFPVGFPTTRLRYGRIFNPPLRVRCIELSLPLVTKGRWQAIGLTEGIRTSGHRQLTTPQSAFG